MLEREHSIPHIFSKKNTRNIMIDVILALFPAMIVSVIFFGIDSVLTIVTSVTSCLMFEYFCSKYWLKEEVNSTRDMSAVLTGVLLACCLPVNLPMIIIVFGAFISIVLTKVIFGGLGRNIFNPALVGRVFLFLCFTVYMISWTKPKFNQFMMGDVQTGATTLELIKYSDASTSATRLNNDDFIAEIPNYFDVFIGNISGSLGELSVLALLLGFIYLLYRRVISWHIPVVYVATVFTILYGTSLFSSELFKYDAVMHVFSGGLLLGAIFMATDYTTSPMSIKGKLIFALGLGVLTVIIRIFSVYNEGVSFAILIMNAFVPLIDDWTRPRIFGSKK